MLSSTEEPNDRAVTIMLAQFQASLAARRWAGPQPPPIPGVTRPRRPGPFDEAGEAAARLEAALELSAGLGEAARARVLATADRLIAKLPVTDPARVHRAVVAPSEANLAAAVETLTAPDLASGNTIVLARLLVRLEPRLSEQVRRGVYMRWLDEVFAGTETFDPSVLLTEIVPLLPPDLFDDAVRRARASKYPERYLAKLAVLDPHGSRDALLEECLELCLREQQPWNFEEILPLLEHWSVDQLLRLAAAVRVAAAAHIAAQPPGHPVWGIKRGPPQICGLIEALSQRGRGDEAIALLEFVPESCLLSEWAKLLHHLPAPEALVRAREILAFVRSDETWPILSAHLLADLAAHADALDLRAEVLEEMLRLPDHRRWALQRFPPVDPATGDMDPRVLAALVLDDSEGAPASAPAMPHLLPREHLEHRWQEGMRCGPELRADRFFGDLVWWRPTMLALGGEAVVEAVALALLED